MVTLYGNREHDEYGGTRQDKQRHNIQKVGLTHGLLLSCLKVLQVWDGKVVLTFSH